MSEIEVINEPKIYPILHQSLNCCGIFSEETCSKNFSLKIDNETLVFCPEGSESCAKVQFIKKKRKKKNIQILHLKQGCVNAVMENTIIPVINVATAMEIIAFGIAVSSLAF